MLWTPCLVVLGLLLNIIQMKHFLIETKSKEHNIQGKICVFPPKYSWASTLPLDSFWAKIYLHEQLKNEDDLKNKDDLKNENDLKNEDNLINEDNLKN